MLHGATLRSPHAAARIRVDRHDGGAGADGVHAVLTAADVPGDRVVGSVARDQPVLCDEAVRHHGEPVAIVAADDAATARRARDADRRRLRAARPDRRRSTTHWRPAHA